MPENAKPKPRTIDGRDTLLIIGTMFLTGAIVSFLLLNSRGPDKPAPEYDPKSKLDEIYRKGYEDYIALLKSENDRLKKLDSIETANLIKSLHDIQGIQDRRKNLPDRGNATPADIERFFSDLEK